MPRARLSGRFIANAQQKCIVRLLILHPQMIAAAMKLVRYLIQHMIRKTAPLRNSSAVTAGKNVRHDNGAIPNLLNELNQCKPEDSGAMRNFACEYGSSYSKICGCRAGYAKKQGRFDWKDSCLVQQCRRMTEVIWARRSLQRTIS